MNVGAIALLTGGALLMHSALTAQSPLADLKSIFSTGKVSSVSTAATVPSPAGTALANVPNEQAAQAALNNRLAGNG